MYEERYNQDLETDILPLILLPKTQKWNCGKMSLSKVEYIGREGRRGTTALRRLR